VTIASGRTLKISDNTYMFSGVKVKTDQGLTKPVNSD
jgi:hypothetical protein